MMTATDTPSMSYPAYMELFQGVVAEGKPYGPPGYDLDYTKLNLARTRRIEKTLRIPPAVQEQMARAVPQTWLVITEPWCGDSAQTLPIVRALAELAPAIELRIVLRDANPDLMDRYLTNGTRSIPKLIAFDAHGTELFQWGPRPASAHALVMGNKTLPEAERLDKDALAEALHRWYHGNAGQEVLAELARLAG